MRTYHFRNIGLALLISAMGIVTVSCKKKKDDPPPAAPKGELELYINPVVNTADLVFGNNYTNGAGNNYKVSEFKMYISEVTFVREDGSEYKDNGIYLVDMSNKTIKSTTAKTSHGGKGALITIRNVPAGTYKGIRFTIGVPTNKNNIDATKITDTNNPLHTNNGMYWSWNAGYIFNKFEGTYDSLGNTKPFKFHIGNSVTEDRRMRINFVNMTNDTHTFIIPNNDHYVLQCSVDVNKFFVNPDGTYHDLNVVANRIVMGGNKATTLAQNMAKAITKN
ncbi:MAG: hypothetical protein NZ455_01100 [Bacteroidia bacterium]|nr:hypothetical protein [Bacteroidia bacterium]MDW8346472.1 hypothetical protein [Bacteroidia bacterium]